MLDHVPHGAECGVLYDLGDFVDDYAVHPRLRNDLGLLILVDLGDDGPQRLEAVPLKLEHCHTRIADGDAGQIRRPRFAVAGAGQSRIACTVQPWSGDTSRRWSPPTSLLDFAWRSNTGLFAL